MAWSNVHVGWLNVIMTGPVSGDKWVLFTPDMYL